MDGRQHKCRGRMAWSIRATGMTEAKTAGTTAKAAA
jgi:hypothetical protein